MSKAWSKVVIAWLAAGALAVGQPAPPPGGPPAAPGLPPGFVPAVPFVAPPDPPPFCPPSPTVTGIVDQAAPPPVAWVAYDQLFWYAKPGPLPVALLTVTSQTVPPPIIPGSLTDPDARVVIGETSLRYGTFNGGRLHAGLWLNYECTFGIEASGFLFEHRSAPRLQSSSDANGFPVLSTPFFDVNRRIESSNSLSVPDVQSGSMFVDSRLKMGGAEGNMMKLMQEWCDSRLIFLFGFRYFNMAELLQISETTGIVAGFQGIFPLTFLGVQDVDFPQTLTYLDSFKVRNHFYGGQVGFRWDWTFEERWELRLQGELAMGAVQRIQDIQGFTTRNATANGPVVAVAEGGFFAQSSNIGRHVSNSFSVMPTTQAKLSYQLFPNVWLNVDYDFLLVNNVIRPGQQIDRAINTSLAPGLADFGQFANGPEQPAVRFDDKVFWAQGVGVGVKVTY